MAGTLLKADLHVHSRHSRRPSEWVLQKLGCAESYTDPRALYAIARERGMDLVTVTDHNVLDGSLEIAHLPGTFVSEEITAYFPEDRCKLHVLAWNITEAQHADIAQARSDVYELAAYLRGSGIAHALAHPLYCLNGRLTPDHFERCLLLFPVFELNGSRDGAQNAMLRDIVTGLGPDDLAYLANRHNLPPLVPADVPRGLCAGSDDHSSLNIARSHTAAPGVRDAAGFLAAVAAGLGQPGGRDATPRTMAHNLYGIVYQFYKSRFKLDGWLGAGLLARFVDRALTPAEDGPGLTARFRDLLAATRSHLRRQARTRLRRRPQARGLKQVLHQEVLEVFRSDSRLVREVRQRRRSPEQAERTWYDFVDQASEKVLRRFGDSVLESFSRADLPGVFQSLGAAGSCYTLLAPYFVAYALFTRDRRFCAQCLDRRRARRGEPAPRRQMRVGHFTDTYYDLNGVALTLQWEMESARKHRKSLTILTSAPASEAEAGPDRPDVLNFAPVGSFSLPEYPGQALHYPPLLKIVDTCFARDFSLIHSATPGPMGLAALAAARILKLPIVATYHTAFPQYAGLLTGDPAMEEAAWRYMVWYYSQMDRIYAPCADFRDELAARGVPAERIRTYPRGIDTERFHPAKRNGFYDHLGLPQDEFRVLYVGRVSREKNLDDLARAFARVAAARPGMRLVVVGDGPYLGQMRGQLAGLPASFTGALHGEDLAQAYASADIFLFPSTTDTFGNVVLEALASGLPVVCSDKGGPKDSVVDGRTGFVVRAGDADGYARAVLSLAEDRPRLAAMRDAARSSVAGRSFDQSFLELWDMHRTAAAQ